MSSHGKWGGRAFSRVLLALLTLALIAANVWIAKHRLEGFAFKTASYASIYHPIESPTVVGFDAVGPGSMEVTLSEPPGKKWTTVSNGTPVDSTGGRRLQLDLAAGRNQFLVEAHVPSDGAGRPRRIEVVGPPDAVFASSDLPAGRFEQYSWSELAHRPEEFPEQDMAQARTLIESAGILSTDSTLTRVEKLWQVLQPRLIACMGVPDPRLRSMSAFDQYQALMNGQSRGWCSSFAIIYGLFATAAGIPVRDVDSGGQIDGVNLSSHAFNELYIQELQQWAYTDMILGILHVRDETTGRYMNTIQLTRLHEAGAVSGLTARVMGADGPEDVPYAQVMQPVMTNLNPNAVYVYHRNYRDRSSPTSWLSRYLFRPELAYRMIGDDRLHYLKLLVFYATALLGLFWIVDSTRWIVRRARAAA